MKSIITTALVIAIILGCWGDILVLVFWPGDGQVVDPVHPEYAKIATGVLSSVTVAFAVWALAYVLPSRNVGLNRPA
ncbi:MAG TPA: hypothetical protein VIM02_03850 [Rhizomicrobium sp.]|jgi:hypothetical protein